MMNTVKHHNIRPLVLNLQSVYLMNHFRLILKIDLSIAYYQNNKTKQTEEALFLDDALWWAEIATAQIALNKPQRHAMLNGNRPSDISDSRQK